MKRHAALVPLSHDHHHALVEGRRLASAAEDHEAQRLDAVRRFLSFYEAETIGHFREEEERLFPLVVGRAEDADELVVRALLEHQRIHALARSLRDSASCARAEADAMRELGGLLTAHVRLEERELFPLIEKTVSDETLAVLAVEPPSPTTGELVVDLLGPSGAGPLWGLETEDLNATLLAWPAGGGPDEHVNRERDVVLVVLAGQATVTVDGVPQLVRGGQALVLEKGCTRSISAGPEGVRYVSIHRRRGPLQISRAPVAQP